MKAKGDRIINIMFSVVGVIMAFIPVWFFIGIRFILSPTGFWQNFFLLGLGVWFLGGFQIILLIILGISLWVIWR